MEPQPRLEARIKAESTGLTLAVEGMSCGHCKLAITDEVTRVARVRGTDVDEATVVGAIGEAGYGAVTT
jgi:copper chaperone CopZ